MSAVHRIALTLGEPAGIGPELIVSIAQQAWAMRLIVIGDQDCLLSCARSMDLPLALLADDGEAREPLPAGQLAIHHIALGRPAQPGKLDGANAAATLATLAEAAAGASAGRYDAIVTAPVQKSALNHPDAPFLGHTEYFQSLAGIERVVMLLVAPPLAERPPLRVALVTTHLPLRMVADALTAERLEQTLRVLHEGLRRDYGLPAPKIAVLGLNPHAGEDGHLGDEELRVITPVLDKLRAHGMQLEGPLPADTAFSPARLARTDAFLAMYHDQGLPVLKYAGFGASVNVTLGLPYVRTSVDHGTALDIAGQQLADPGSLQCAIHEAARMLRARSPASRTI